jgi:hypothetical protein
VVDLGHRMGGKLRDSGRNTRVSFFSGVEQDHVLAAAPEHGADSHIMLPPSQDIQRMFRPCEKKMLKGPSFRSFEIRIRLHIVTRLTSLHRSSNFFLARRLSASLNVHCRLQRAPSVIVESIVGSFLTCTVLGIFHLLGCCCLISMSRASRRLRAGPAQLLARFVSSVADRMF